MALKNKYQREKQQYSNDGGMTWLDVSPANYRRGRLLEAASEDCNTIEWIEVLGSWFCIGFEETEYRWVTVDGQYECVGYDKYTKEKKQQSTDGGQTWTDVVPLETKAGSLIQANSEDCGYVPPTPGGYSNQYLTFEAIEDGTFTFYEDVSYTIDNGETWTVLAAETNTPTITTGNKIMWKAEITPISNYGIGAFSSSGRYNVEGNPMSLLFGDNFKGKTDLTGKDYAFFCLFTDSNLVNAQNLSLPATTLASNCYDGMFQACTSLVTAPELPATTLAMYCYKEMFRGCTSLTTAPELPATTLAIACYSNMFRNCTSLVNVPQLPVTTLADSCYVSMFQGCTSLTTAPTLPATELVVECYERMFSGCTSLSYIKAMFTTTPGYDYTSSWVSGVASSGTFVKNSAATWNFTGNDSIPRGWTIQNA